MATKSKSTVDVEAVTITRVDGTVVVDNEWGRKIRNDVKVFRDLKNEAAKGDDEATANVKAVLGEGVALVTQDGETLFTTQEVVYAQQVDKAALELFLKSVGKSVEEFLLPAKVSRRLIVTEAVETIPEARKG